MQMTRISGYIAEIANKKEMDDATLAELEQLFNMRICDVKPPSVVPPNQNLPQGSSRKRSYDPQSKSMMFPKSTKRTHCTRSGRGFDLSYQKKFHWDMKL